MSIPLHEGSRAKLAAVSVLAILACLVCLPCVSSTAIEPTLALVANRAIKAIGASTAIAGQLTYGAKAAGPSGVHRPTRDARIDGQGGRVR